MSNTWSVEMSIHAGQALAILRDDELGEAAITVAPGQDSDGNCDADDWSGDEVPEPPAEILAEAKAVARGWEGMRGE